MARLANKRRGITLGPRTDSAATLDLLGAKPAATDKTPPAGETAGGAPGAGADAMPEQLVQLQRANADLDMRLRHQAEQLRALEQNRRTSRRRGVLLSLLALACVAALGFHTWPQIQDLAGDVNRAYTSLGQIAPQLQSVRGRVTSLTSDLGQMGSAMASLREDVSDVRSDLGSLRQATITVPEGNGAMQANVGGTRSIAHALPGNATTMRNPYRTTRPRMPW
jgi:hypothetical protein